MTIKFKKLSSFVNSTIYQVTNGQKTFMFEVTHLGKDKLGHLKRIECSQIPMFESYKMKDIKTKIVSFFLNSQSINV